MPALYETRIESREARENGAHVAQSVEHFLGKEEVTGSIPVVGFANYSPTRDLRGAI
jgi:hypothetical protein